MKRAQKYEEAAVVLKEMLEAGFNPNAQALYINLCSLPISSPVYSVMIAQLFLEYVADPNLGPTSQYKEYFPLFSAFSWRGANAGVIKLLLEYGANPNIQNECFIRLYILQGVTIIIP